MLHARVANAARNDEPFQLVEPKELENSQYYQLTENLIILIEDSKVHSFYYGPTILDKKVLNIFATMFF